MLCIWLTLSSHVSLKEPSLLLSLIQEVKPLDVSQISKEASPDSTDAMKRTVSGMLGILPSDQFHVTVGTSREPLEKLLVSSMMTGYVFNWHCKLLAASFHQNLLCFHMIVISHWLYSHFFAHWMVD